MGRPAILGVLVALALAAPAQAAPAVHVALRSLDPQAILRTGELNVRVAARSGGRVRVSAGKLARARIVRFQGRGRRTVRLALTAEGRRVLRRCGRRRIAVRAGRRVTRRLLRPAPAGSCTQPPGTGSGGGAGGAGGAGASGGSGGSSGSGSQPQEAGFETPAGCDFLDAAVCLQPWPNDYFTVEADTPTGRRLDLQLTAMPRNIAQKPIDPSDYNRNDGFSPGSPIHTRIPGLDNQAAFDRTGLVPITDMARTYDDDQPAVVIDAATGERHLIWAELDANAAQDADRNLYIRPGTNFEEGHRYIVALRDLRRADGSTIEPARSFAVYRDGIVTTSPEVEARRTHMESLFASLQGAGIARADLYLAWDFTVGSAERIAGRMLKLRDEAFGELGDTDLADLHVQGTAPLYAITDSEDFTVAQDPKVARHIEGTFTVPCYLDAPGCPPGSRFAFASLTGNEPLRVPLNTMLANFECNIPRSASVADKARPSLYGHGLLGSASEMNADNVKTMGQDHDVIFCATDWSGMSTQDVPNVGTILTDLSNFPTLADRVQQGMLNFLYLGRLMIHPAGFPADPAFLGVIDPSRLFYDGNSQGGIIGGSLVAVAPDLQRGVLGVPGMNYSTLLQRSIDFDEYSVVLYAAYPNELERPMLFSLIQQLWDRAEANGYAHHLTDDPLPNTPAHVVLMHPAFGDHQVANVAADVEARTIGARIRANPTDPGRHTDVDPYYAIPRIQSYPYDGSAMEVWDTGAGHTPAAPTTNTPPAAGEDPHSAPRRTPAAQDQKSAFLRIGGEVVDRCAGAPCHAVP